VRMGNPRLVEVTAETRVGMQAVAADVDVPRLLAAIRSFNRAASEGRAGWQPSLPLEMAFMEAVQEDVEASGNPVPASPARPPETAPAPRTGGGTPKSSTSPAPVEASDPPAMSSAPAPTGEITIQHVLERWRDILAAARRRDPRTQALLNSSRPLGLEDGVLVLGFASDVLRDKMEKGHSLELAKAALREVLGGDLGIRSALTMSVADAQAGEGSSPSIDTGGMVAAALKDLGAEVVDVRPLQPEERAPDV
jgi:hypothetical protein